MAAVQSETRSVGEFTAVSLDGIGTLNVRYAELPTVTIEAEPDALELVTTDVENGSLRIGTTLKSNKVLSLKHPPVFTVGLPLLRELHLRSAGRAVVQGNGMGEDLLMTMDGAGEIRLEEAELKRLRARIAGAGSIRGSGTAEIQDIEISGTGNYSGSDLTGEAIAVIITGAGRAKVNATRLLDVTISGIGSVSYHGNPEVRQNVGGLGRVSRA